MFLINYHSKLTKTLIEIIENINKHNEKVLLLFRLNINSMIYNSNIIFYEVNDLVIKKAVTVK